MQTPEELLQGWGLTDRPWEYDSSIHSWRCEHPDRYGECSCFQEIAQELAARDEAIRADERAKVLAGFEVEAAPCGQTKWTPGADPLLKAIECAVPPTKHGSWHVSDGHRWRVTDALPVLSSRIRLVGPWEAIEVAP